MKVGCRLKVEDVTLLFVMFIFVILYAARCHAGSTESFSNSITKPYMESRKEYYDEMRGDVESDLEDWINNPFEGQWRTGNPDPEPLFEKESDRLIEEQVEKCNKAEIPKTHQHTWDDLHAGYAVHTSSCSIYYEYLGEGDKAGECKKLIPVPPPCGIFEIKADLIDYYYPTSLRDSSNEAFYSPHLDQKLVLGLSTESNTESEDSESSNSGNNSQESNSSQEPNITDSGPAHIKNLDDKLESSTQGRKMLKETLKIFNSRFGISSFNGALPEYKVLTSPEYGFIMGNNKHFGRVFPLEKINEEHKMEFPHDLGNEELWAHEMHGWKLAYFLSEMEEVDQEMFERLMESPEACARHDMATGKTPDYPKKMNSAWTARIAEGTNSKYLHRMQCLTNIGPIVPYTASRSPAVTDAFYQGFGRTQKAFRQFMKKEQKHAYTFKTDVDRLSFVPEDSNPHEAVPDEASPESLVIDDYLLNDELRDEIKELNKTELNPDLEDPNCTVFEKAVHPNHKFEEVNVKDVEKRDLVSLSVMTGFSGCWVVKKLPIIIRTRPSMHGKKELRIE